MLDEPALRRGYLVATSGLNVNSANVNHTVAAEALTMLKEHVVETTARSARRSAPAARAAASCSTSSRLLPGPARRHPAGLQLPGRLDDGDRGARLRDAAALLRPPAGPPGPRRRRPRSWAPTDPSACTDWNLAFLPKSYPDRAQNCGWAESDPRVYHPETNPGGTRCGIQDYPVAIWGRRPRALGPTPRRTRPRFRPRRRRQRRRPVRAEGAAVRRITPAEFADSTRGSAARTSTAALSRTGAPTRARRRPPTARAR